MSTENQKIPCGGFRIGDGLTMDGNTLKSLGGAYVKVINNGETYEFMDDSPLKTFEEIRQKGETSFVTLQLHEDNTWVTLSLESISDISISFSSLRVSGNLLIKAQILIDSDNKIILSQSLYTLTPAT